MEHSPHVLLIGDAAIAFCRERVLPLPIAITFTPTPAGATCRKRWRRRRPVGLAVEGEPDEARRHGTVGAVATALAISLPQRRPAA
jgi:beta-aspartyl-peptidase (threonine type)